MALLSERDSQFLKNHFAESMDKPVRLLFFTQTVACQYCRETEQILREVASLSDKISVGVYNLITDKDVAASYGIDKIPATVVMSDVDRGIRFFGLPSGYEFTSLVEDIIDVSNGSTGLSDTTLKLLAALDQDVHIQVFITPTCPYCPAAVRLAHSMAIASERVKADMVESIEFPHLANRYQVYGVPRTVINEDTHVEGAVPEPIFVAKVLQALGKISAEEVDQLYHDLMEKAQAEGERLEGIEPESEERA